MTEPLHRTVVRCDGRSMKAYSATCGTCGRSEVVKCNSFRTTHGSDDEIELKFVKRKLFGLYWRIGKTEQQNRCPKCMAAIIAASRYKQAKEKLMNTATKQNGQQPPPELAEQMPQAQQHATPPREMSRDDRRLIFQKLDEVYDRSGYSGGWSDSRVASDLGVPRAWVSKLRLEFFGDDGGSEEAKKLVDDARVLLRDVSGFSAQMTDQLARFAQRYEHLEKRIDELTKVGGRP